MRRGYLSQFFSGAGAKRLTAVEVDPGTSRQHEFQGTSEFRAIFGTPAEKQTFAASFLWLTDTLDPDRVDAFVTWSNVRKGKPRSPEYHLYYAADAEPLVHRAEPGDLLVVAIKQDGSVVVLIADAGSTWERQLLWLFDLDRDLFKNGVRNLDHESRKLDLAAKAILEAIEIDIEESAPEWLDELTKKFGSTFPPTATFSAFARSTLLEVRAAEGPDAALVAWMEREELLFRTLEQHIVGMRLKNGFTSRRGKPQVDEFISFSLSVQNRRKSRVGHALENHLEAVFKECGVAFNRGAETENKAKPDFLFPGKPAYDDNKFPTNQLAMLGAKSTCKDRWRQVLAEAKRIQKKHLLTLEPSISENQTDEMRANKVQLVLPQELHATYLRKQQLWLMSLSEFIAQRKEAQSKKR